MTKPAVDALYTRVPKAGSPLAPWLFAGGYLLAWTVAGLLAYVVGVAAAAAHGDRHAWDPPGPEIAAATQVVAAV